MIIVKITNLSQPNGKADYKGLDTALIVGGTQVYPTTDNVAYFFYDGEATLSAECEIISREVYDAEKLAFENAPKPVMESDRINALESIVFDALMGGKL